MCLSIVDQAKEDRNGYFHKDNIDVWDKIEEARVLSYLILALLLGAYEYSDQDRLALNIPEENEETEYYKFCAYLNYNADQLFYISLNGDDVIPVFATADDNIEINEYGDPRFSGIYFRKVYGVGAERIEISAEETVHKHTIITGEIERYSEDSLPVRIYTGQMAPGKKGMVFSGPLILIYENGRYMLPEQILHIGY